MKNLSNHAIRFISMETATSTHEVEAKKKFRDLLCEKAKCALAEK